MSKSGLLPVIECFGPVVQGEGMLAGQQTMFVRLGGCDYRCMPRFTRVMLSGGEEKHIPDVVVGDKVLGMIPGGFIETEVTHVANTGLKQVFAIYLETGEMFMATPDHQVWVEPDDISQNPYVEVGNLKAGSFLRGPIPGTMGSPSRFVAVADVRPVAVPAECYDITTGTDNFVANGFLVHNCSWCDSLFAVDAQLVRLNKVDMSPQSIVERLQELGMEGVPWVTLSGGNPCIHDLSELVNMIQTKGAQVAVETQGTIFAPWALDCDVVTLSPKPPSSGMQTNYAQLTKWLDELFDNRLWGMITEECKAWGVKVVVFDEADYAYARTIRELVAKYSLNIPFYVMPGTSQTISSEENISMIQLSPAPKLTLPQQREELRDIRNDILDRTVWLTDKVMADPIMRSVRIMPQLHALAYGYKRGV